LTDVTLLDLERNEDMACVLVPIKVRVDIPILDFDFLFWLGCRLRQLSNFVDISIEFSALLHEHSFLHEHSEPLISFTRLLILTLWLDWVCFLNQNRPAHFVLLKFEMSLRS